MPEFTPWGCLPEGVHVCTLGELAARLGGSPGRLALLGKLSLFLRDEWRRLSVKPHLYIGGSFVREVAEPRDMDLVADTRALAPADAAGVLALLLLRRAEIRHHYGIDIRPRDPWVSPALAAELDKLAPRAIWNPMGHLTDERLPFHDVLEFFQTRVADGKGQLALGQRAGVLRLQIESDVR